MSDRRFQKELEDTVKKCDPKLDPREVLVSIFKTYIAGMLIENVSKNYGRLEEGFVNMVKAQLITDFRDADLGDFQLSVKRYEDLFAETIKEILNDAAHNHEGSNEAIYNQQQLVVNKKAYEEHLKSSGHMTDGGIYLPGGVKI